jgi:two-component sensor histidine kinase/integral membrane sensor domain MASE1
LDLRPARAPGGAESTPIANRGIGFLTHSKGLIHNFLLIAFVAIAYFAAARLGLALAFKTTQVSAVWPPAGIAVAALLVLGNRTWPGIYLAALVVNAMENEPLPVALCIAGGNTATALIGACILRALRFDGALLRSRDVVSLYGVAIGSPLVSATIGITALAMGRIVPWSRYTSVWEVWWIGDSLGILIVAPVLLTWINNPRIHWRRARLIEFVAFVCTAVLICLVVFVLPPSGSIPLFPRAYIAFPLLAWAGLRLGSREAALGAALVSAFALWGGLHGHGPFSRDLPEDRLVLLDTFIGTIGCTALLIAAVIAERQGARAAAYEELEERVRERTAALAAAVEELGHRNQEKETLLREIHHRVKNNLQVVCSLLSLQAQGQDESRLITFAEDCRARVRSMALVHEQLYQSKNLQSVPLASYLTALVEEVAHAQPASGKVSCRVDATDIALPVDQAIPCGLIVNELVTNSLKHGFPDSRTGQVGVSITCKADRIELIVTDDGVGIPETVDFSGGNGFGLALVSMLADQLHATIDIERHAGTRIDMSFPSRRIA